MGPTKVLLQCGVCIQSDSQEGKASLAQISADNIFSESMRFIFQTLVHKECPKKKSLQMSQSSSKFVYILAKQGGSAFNLTIFDV